jgi:hypothetical protein
VRKLSLELKLLFATGVDAPILATDADEGGAFGTAAHIPTPASTDSPMIPARTLKLLRFTEAMVSFPLRCDDLPHLWLSSVILC